MVLQHTQNKAIQNASVDKKGAHEVLSLAEDLYGFDAYGGRRVNFFFAQYAAIAILML